MVVLEAKANDLLDRSQNFMYPALCYIKLQNTILSIGGEKPSVGCKKNVEIYNVESDYWDVAPEIKQARSRASSCCHDNFVYIFCG